ncbi:NAD-dependent epimerase/dehydratase family protein [Micromonospora sp. WMMC415]|uniref:NAD-dependent epimerase/dehydratase family protein n=1 Tax=Micromonospora sp. WMMC415 TaxID=2675222 RepID=UPI0012B49EFA|nr:NAD(P)-dependent oxidoreductase [Micromonospora sp. WMMC415]QGN49193.1 NAD-dependent epimerase/dehydratase family protein [Micromonospora sp. WMMC415]
MTRLDGEWLLTGAAGQIGGILRTGLRPVVPGLRLLDIKPLTAESPNERVYSLDLQDLPGLTEAMAGVQGVIHLAGIADEADFRDLTEVNIVGTYHVFEAARRASVARVIFASSNHVTGYYPTTVPVVPDMPVRPDGFYGVSKVAGEAVARLYADKFGLEVACLRIGSCRPRPTEPRHRHTWLSPRDATAAFVAAMSTPDLTYATFYGVSANQLGWWDREAGRAIGYHPSDRAEDHLGGATWEPATDEVQGGVLATAAYTLDRQRPIRTSAIGPNERNR